MERMTEDGASAIAIAVVPGGFGSLFLHTLPTRSAAAAAASPTTLHPGASRGELGVDLIFIRCTATIEWLSHTHLPLIALMALIAHCPASLDALKAAVQMSERWESALALWGEWRWNEWRDQADELEDKYELRSSRIRVISPLTNAVHPH